MSCLHCGAEIMGGSKYFPLERRKYCSGICVQKAWLVKNRPQRKVQGRRSHLKNTFGITPEDFVDLYKAQNGRCAICGLANMNYIDKKGRERPSLFIDHEHLGGGVRGLLCHGCNTGLGHFRDSVELLESAINYMRSGIKITKKDFSDPRHRLKCKDTSHELMQRSTGGVRCRTCYLAYLKMKNKKRKISRLHQGN